MKVVFTGSYEDLKLKLSDLGSDWDDSQANKKVLRSDGGVMNWYESTGTLQFQGKDKGRRVLEAKVKQLLYPGVLPRFVECLYAA